MYRDVGKQLANWRRSAVGQRAKRVPKRERFKIIKSRFVCLRCGESEPACLDFHHKDPTTKIAPVAQMAIHCSEEKLVDEIAKCIVICSNCHRKLHAKLWIIEELP